MKFLAKILSKIRADFSSPTFVNVMAFGATLWAFSYAFLVFRGDWVAEHNRVLIELESEQNRRESEQNRHEETMTALAELIRRTRYPCR